ncbi:MAG: kelch repeat-containing protein [Tepidisphaeraceae bacterium]|jgi:hypothetical protein
MMLRGLLGVSLLLICTGANRKLESADLKQAVIWTSECDLGGGLTLRFGGQDQRADDGRVLTWIRENGQWHDLSPDLRKNNPLQAKCDETWKTRDAVKQGIAQLRRAYFDDTAPPEAAVRSLNGASKATAAAIASLQTDTPGALGKLTQAQFALEQEAESHDAEPAARALSPLAYDAAHRRVWLFGGDHLDYLTNDLWAFDVDKRRWERLDVPAAPSPRAGHTLSIDPDGKLTLTGGYTYTSTTDYMGGQYRDLPDGPFTFDPAAAKWTGQGQLVADTTRTYRTGPYHPDFYYVNTPKPDAKATAAILDNLPPNAWTRMRPPRLPKQNRDWGTAVLDPVHGLILRWSGGHCAHGGTDVLHYHLATNRWELCYPVEFPLGQLYSNTSYPEGRNFNGRPWITGHSYQSYAFDPLSHKLIFAGRRTYSYIYDLDAADWTDRYAKPAGMDYDSSYYTLTLTSTPKGLVCWTHDGRLFLGARASSPALPPATQPAAGNGPAPIGQWTELKLTGRLPGSVVDSSTLTFDSQRNRLLFFRREYDSKKPYDGQVYAVNLDTLEVSPLSPTGADLVRDIPYLCQIRYTPDHDLCLAAARMTIDGTQSTPVYDCARNAWTFLNLTGDDPNGKSGRNVSLGLMYDAQRKLFWATDANCEVYVMKLSR